MENPVPPAALHVDDSFTAIAKMSYPHEPSNSPTKDQGSRPCPDETDTAGSRPPETPDVCQLRLAPQPTNMRTSSTARVGRKRHRYRVPSIRVKRRGGYVIIRGRRGRKGEEIKRIGLNGEWTDPEPPITVCYNSDIDSDSDSSQEPPTKRNLNQVNDNDEDFEFSWFERWWYSINQSEPTKQLECSTVDEGSPSAIASDGHRAKSSSNFEPDEVQPSCNGER